MKYLKFIMPKFYHVLAQGWAFGLQLNQSSQPFHYLLQKNSWHFICDLDYPILQLQVSLDVCAHILLTLWKSTFYVMFMVMNALDSMMEFTIPLPPLHETLTSMRDKNNYMFFLQPHSTHFVNKSTLCFPKMAFTP